MNTMHEPTIMSNTVITPPFRNGVPFQITPSVSPEASEPDFCERETVLDVSPKPSDVSDWVAESIKKNRILTPDIIADIRAFHTRKLEQEKAARTVTPVAPTVPTESATPTVMVEDGLNDPFFLEKLPEHQELADATQARAEWKQEEDRKYYTQREKMGNRTWREKLTSAAQMVRNGLSALLPNSAGRSINENLQTSVHKGELTSGDYEQMRQPTLMESLSKRWDKFKGSVREFASNFSRQASMNESLDGMLASGEIDDEAYTTLRKPTLKERFSSAGKWMSSHISFNSGNKPESSDTPSDNSGSSDSGNENGEGDNGGNGNPPRKRKRWGLVGALTLGAAFLASYAGYKKLSESHEQAPVSSSTAPKPTVNVVPTSVPTQQKHVDSHDETPEKKTADVQPPVRVSPKKAKVVVPVKPHYPETPPVVRKNKTETPVPPPVVKKNEKPQEKISSLQLYYDELKAQWARIQSMEQRMKFVYGRHVSAQPARTLASVLDTRIPFHAGSSTLHCEFNCGVYDEPRIVELLNEARGLMGSGRFEAKDTAPQVALKIAEGRQKVREAQGKIDEAEKLFADEERAANRTFMANRVAYTSLQSAHAHEKLAYVEHLLAQKGIPADGTITIHVHPNKTSSTTHIDGKSSYTVNVYGTSQAFNISSVRGKLAQVERDLKESPTTLTPQDTQKTYQSVSAINTTLDQMISMAKHGEVSATPEKTARKSSAASPAKSRLLKRNSDG